MYSSSYYGSYSSPYYSSTYPSSSSSDDLGAVVAGIFASFAVLFIIAGIAAIVVLVARWMIFKKANKKPWESLIPVHNFIVEMEMGGVETYWYFLNLVAVIPFIGWIAPVVLSFWKNIALAKSFGKTAGYGVGLTLLSVIFYPMLGFGKAQYIGPQPKNTYNPNMNANVNNGYNPNMNQNVNNYAPNPNMNQNVDNTVPNMDPNVNNDQNNMNNQ